jgi:hypothetical protein
MSRVDCRHCRATGIVGRKLDGYGVPTTREAPGPVPDGVSGWGEYDCPVCRGEGTIEIDDEDEQ